MVTATNNARVELGKLIEKAREANGKSREELSELLGLSMATVARIERGKTRIKSGLLERIITTYTIPVATVKKMRELWINT